MSLITSERFSPERLLAAMQQSSFPQAASRILSLPPQPVYVSAASHTGLPVKFIVDPRERTIEDITITSELAKAYQKILAEPNGERNDDSSSIASMNQNISGEFELQLRPTKFFIGRAVARELSNLPEASLDFLNKHSPNMFNISLIVITEIAGQRYLLCQEKGKAIGQGEIHTLFAGGVSAKSLAQPHPQYAGLITQAKEEIGLNLNPNNLKPVAFVSEVKLGMLNVVYAAFTPDHEKILTAFETSTKQKMETLRAAGQLQARGIGLANVGSLLAVPINEQCNISGPIVMYRAKEDGNLEILKYEGRKVRPYWNAISQLIQYEPTLIDSWAQNFELRSE